VVQRKRKVAEERRKVVDEEVKKLVDARFISEIKYPTWLANTFHKWAVDITGPFPVAPGQLKFLIVGVDYFTKWIEAEAFAKITAERIRKFYWKKIIRRFGLPKYIVSANGTQFASSTVIDFCKHLGIQTKFVSVIHPVASFFEDQGYLISV